MALDTFRFKLTSAGDGACLRARCADAGRQRVRARRAAPASRRRGRRRGCVEARAGECDGRRQAAMRTSSSRSRTAGTLEVADRRRRHAIWLTPIAGADA